MLNLYRTSSPPTTYKADVISLAFLLRSLFFISTYLLPFINTIFFLVDNSQSQIYSERPFVTPGDVLYFSVIAIDEDSNTDVSTEYPFGSIITSLATSTTPYYDSQGTLTEFDINLQYKIPDDAAGNVSSYAFFSFNIIFNYTVQLSSYSSSINQGFGLLSVNSGYSFDSVTAYGELQLQQSVAADFRGELPNANISYDSLTFENFLKAQNNASSVYYIDWISHSASPQPRDSAGSLVQSALKSTLTFTGKITIPNLNIIHSQPLISIIETLIHRYLSLYILCRIVFGFIQNIIFSKGLVTTWHVRHYNAPEFGKD